MEPADGHVIVLTQRGRNGAHVAGVFTTLAAMRAFLRARGQMSGLLYTRHDVALTS